MLPLFLSWIKPTTGKTKQPIKPLHRSPSWLYFEGKVQDSTPLPLLATFPRWSRNSKRLDGENLRQRGPVYGTWRWLAAVWLCSPWPLADCRKDPLECPDFAKVSSVWGELSWESPVEIAGACLMNGVRCAWVKYTGLSLWAWFFFLALGRLCTLVLMRNVADCEQYHQK